MRQGFVRWMALVSAALALGGVRGARAQEDGDLALRVQQFDPNATGLGIFTLESARTGRPFRPMFNVHFNYAAGVLGSYNGDQLQEWAIDRQVGVDLQAGIGFGGVDVMLQIPFVALQTGAGLPGGDQAISPFGDVAIKPKVRLLDPDRRRVGLAVAMPLTLPTGNGAALNGDRSVTATPTAITEVRLGPLDLAANLGVVARRKVEIEGLTVGSQLLYRVGVRVWPWHIFALQVEAWGLGGAASTSSPANWLGGIHVHNRKGFLFQMGVGTGLGPGYGAPKLRVLMGFGVAARPSVDRDGDGIANGDDPCPEEPEDADGFEDGDGCPDPDNDGDGIADGDDACPDRAETVNGFQDEDGCPDEVADRDGDGIADGDDPCPDEPEDADGFEDGDGCPDPDNDGDGIADGDDACPDQAETVNGHEDEDGCPDEEALVRIDEAAGCIVVRERIHFDTGKATLSADSFPILNRIADLLLRRDDVGPIEIQGHTDERGEAEANRSLSQRRAETVRRFLVNRGVDGERLLARGYGEDQPLRDGHDEESWAENRRVEFHILD